MYVLYLDDAGSVENANDRHFVLAGIAVFERQIYFLDKELQSFAAELNPSGPSELEFHANHILTGRGIWRSMGSKERRREILAHGLALQGKLKGHSVLFGAVVEKAAVSPEDPVEYAFEHLCNRFDLFLGRLFKRGDQQRGIIVLDKSTRETRLQQLAADFRVNGHRWGVLRNLADVPFFVDSRATRAIQYADMVAYALWRKFEKNDPAFHDGIARAFDTQGGIVHGLFVKSLADQSKQEN